MPRRAGGRTRRSQGSATNVIVRQALVNPGRVLWLLFALLLSGVTIALFAAWHLGRWLLGTPPQQPAGFEIDPVGAAELEQVFDDYRGALAARGYSMSDATVARLLLGGTERCGARPKGWWARLTHLAGGGSPAIDAAAHSFMPIERLPSPMQSVVARPGWHALQQATVHSVVTIFTLWMVVVLLNKALRVRLYSDLRHRRSRSILSWSCIVCSSAVMSLAPISLGALATCLALMGLVLQLDIIFGRARSI